MIPAADNQTLPDGESSSPLAARLELLLQHAINTDQFEADMVRACRSDPEEIWDLLALLDQHHRLGKAADRIVPRAEGLRRSLRTGASPELHPGAGRQCNSRQPPPSTPAADRPRPPTPTPPPPEPMAQPPEPMAPPPEPMAPPLCRRHGAAGRRAAGDGTRRPPHRSRHPPPSTNGRAGRPPCRRIAAAPTLGVGSVVGNRYRLEAELDSDDRGRNFQALDLQHAGQPAAVCQVEVHCARPKPAEFEATLAERRTEFQIAQPLAHPNVLTVRELDQDGVWIYLTMNLMRGETLAALLARRLGKALPAMRRSRSFAISALRSATPTSTASSTATCSRKTC